MLQGYCPLSRPLESIVILIGANYPYDFMYMTRHGRIGINIFFFLLEIFPLCPTLYLVQLA